MGLGSSSGWGQLLSAWPLFCQCLALTSVSVVALKGCGTEDLWKDLVMSGPFFVFFFLQ